MPLDLSVHDHAAADGGSDRERFLATVLQTIGSLVLVLDGEGRIRLFNRACEEVSGYTFEEVRGRCVWDVLLPSEVVGAVKQAFSELRAGRPNEHENVWVAKDGTRRNISWSNTVLADDLGRVQYVIPTGVDITEVRRAEQRAAETEDRYRRLFEHAHDAIYLCELPGEDGQGLILEANEPACVRLGYSREELLRTRVVDVHPPQGHDDCREALRRGQGALIFETLERRRDGTLLPVELSIHALELEGRTVVLTVSRDLSERKRLEQQLLEATRLDAIGRLAGGVAHDFNNLLVVILSSAHAILEAMPDDHPLREEAQQIADAGSGAALLTQQLLTYGRRGVVKPVPLDLNDTVATTSKLLGRLLGERIRIELRLASRIGSVVIDRGRIQQVVMNLAVNARDAMPGGGTVTIETARVELPGVHLGAPSRAFVNLRVKDTGCGMGPEVRAHLFQPFFTTKADGLGTGLGLATTHQIVSAAGGHIDVASEVGAGACFSVYLPCLAAEAHHVAPQRPPAPSLSGLEVLLVEDEAAVLRATARMLESAGCHVFATRDPLEALRLIQGQPDRVELLVTDLVMPGLSGKELANALHVVRPELPVVFISGHEHDLLGTEGQLDASVHLVEKPFEAASLIATVAAARDRP